MNRTPPDPAEWGPDTLAVRGGLQRSEFAETSEGLFLTQGYVYETAAEAEAVFAGELDRFSYSRYGNPTVRMFEERLRLMEGAEDCFATASGMAGVFNALMAVVNAGDRVVASRALFGPCWLIINNLLPRWGVTPVFVDGHDLDQWRDALSEPTAAVFFESPSNPMQDLIDIPAVCRLAHDAGAVVICDNVFATPLLQKPLELGADVVVYSATKHIDGQGRVLGGAILGSTTYIRECVEPLMRQTGPSISPFNAWVLVKSMETLRIRVDHQCRSAMAVAEWLEAHPRVAFVRYPFLPSHPQYELARKQQTAGGTVVTFAVGATDGKKAAFAALDSMKLIDISNNLGDAKSLVTHPATTTHRRLSADERHAMGITDGIVRLSIGLEDVGDIIADLDYALSQA